MPSSKPVRAWCIKGPEGRLMLWTLAEKRGRAIGLAERHEGRWWDSLRRRGWRSVRVTITEEQDD